METVRSPWGTSWGYFWGNTWGVPVEFTLPLDADITSNLTDGDINSNMDGAEITRGA